MATRIFLIRHGGTLLSVEERFAGSTDVQLSDDGREQAKKLGERLKTAKIDAVYCSTMQRTFDTAMAIAWHHRLTPTRVADLREIDHGKWEGLVHKDVEHDFAADYAKWSEDPFTTAPPGGETGLAVLSRALPAMHEIVLANQGKTVVVVSHKATNRLLLAHYLGIDPRLYRERVTQDLACLNLLHFPTPSEARLVLMNDINHYSNLPEV